MTVAEEMRESLDLIDSIAENHWTWPSMDKPQQNYRLKIKQKIKNGLNKVVRGEPLKNYEKAAFIEIAGMWPQQLLDYLEKDGLKWGDPGVSIDHIVPASLAKDKEETRLLNHWTNLRLMMYADNVSKGHELPDESELHPQMPDGIRRIYARREDYLKRNDMGAKFQDRYAGLGISSGTAKPEPQPSPDSS